MTEHRLIYRYHTNLMLGLSEFNPTKIYIECSCGWFGGSVLFKGHKLGEDKWKKHVKQEKQKLKEHNTHGSSNCIP